MMIIMLSYADLADLRTAATMDSTATELEV